MLSLKASGRISGAFSFILFSEMKILLPTIGTRGDNQLFLALAKALIDAGHEPTVALGEKYIPLAASYGINTLSLGGNQDEGVKEVREMISAKSTLEAARIGTKSFHKGVRQHTAILQRLCIAYDLIVGYGSFGQAEADKANKPYISVVIEPTMAEKRLSKSIRQNIRLISERMALYFLMKREYNRFRKDIEAPSEKQSRNPQLILLPMSEHIVKCEANWTTKNVITGFWYLKTPASYSPPKELQRFVQPEDKPIFISFGSAGWNEQDDNTLLQLFFDALSMVNKRAVIVTSGDTERNDIPGNVHLINDVPHDWMFPQVSCVVHHCGLGTTAAVLKSGIPSIPIPHIVDQFAWAKRIHALGVATEPISRKQLTVEKLARAITEALVNPTIRMNARNLAIKLQEENGLKSAVEVIERVMRTNRISSK